MYIVYICMKLDSTISWYKMICTSEINTNTQRQEGQMMWKFQKQAETVQVVIRIKPAVLSIPTWYSYSSYKKIFFYFIGASEDSQAGTGDEINHIRNGCRNGQVGRTGQ